MKNPYMTQQRSALDHKSPQQAEAYALVEMARRIDQAANMPNGREKLLSELRINWKIWTIIQAELVEADCPLPSEIRQNLLNLSNFVDKRTSELLVNPDPKKVAVLVNINRNIGAGLMGNPGTGQGDQTPSTTGTDSSALNHL